MTFQSINAGGAVLYWTRHDLQERGLVPDQLTDEDICRLARQAFLQAGIPFPTPPEMELWCDRCGLLLFVHAVSPSKTVWVFDGVETARMAAATLREPEPGGALYRWDGRVWLVLPAETDAVSAHLSEFAHAETQDPYIYPRLAEYGTLLLPEGALTALREYF